MLKTLPKGKCAKDAKSVRQQAPTAERTTAAALHGNVDARKQGPGTRAQRLALSSAPNAISARIERIAYFHAAAYAACVGGPGRGSVRSLAGRQTAGVSSDGHAAQRNAFSRHLRCIPQPTHNRGARQ